MQSVPGFVSLSDAAHRLGVSDSRVRALLRAGALEGTKVAGRWLVADRGLHERSRSGAPSGRRLRASNAWTLLALGSGASAPWAEPSELRRMMQLLDERGIQALAPRLASRARRLSFYAHPGVLPELVSDFRLAITGVSAPVARELGVVGGGELDAYLPFEQLQPMIEQFALQRRNGDANVSLRLLPVGLDFAAQHPTPRAAVALDLAEGAEPRGQEAGRVELRRIDAERPWQRGR
jgi:hypothetical protein